MLVDGSAQGSLLPAHRSRCHVGSPSFHDPCQQIFFQGIKYQCYNNKKKDTPLCCLWFVGIQMMIEAATGTLMSGMAGQTATPPRIPVIAGHSSKTIGRKQQEHL